MEEWQGGVKGPLSGDTSCTCSCAHALRLVSSAGHACLARLTTVASPRLAELRPRAPARTCTGADSQARAAAHCTAPAVFRTQPLLASSLTSAFTRASQKIHREFCPHQPGHGFPNRFQPPRTGLHARVDPLFPPTRGRHLEQPRATRWQFEPFAHNPPIPCMLAHMGL